MIGLCDFDGEQSFRLSFRGVGLPFGVIQYAADCIRVFHNALSTSFETVCHIAEYLLKHERTP
jgi:hypothetical protein